MCCDGVLIHPVETRFRGKHLQDPYFLQFKRNVKLVLCAFVVDYWSLDLQAPKMLLRSCDGCSFALLLCNGYFNGGGVLNF